MIECPECGNTKEFLAKQQVTGTIDVIVNSGGEFNRNPTIGDHIDPDGLNFSNPEGPYTCYKCLHEFNVEE